MFLYLPLVFINLPQWMDDNISGAVVILVEVVQFVWPSKDILVKMVMSSEVSAVHELWIAVHNADASLSFVISGYCITFTLWYVQIIQTMVWTNVSNIDPARMLYSHGHRTLSWFIGSWWVTCFWLVKFSAMLAKFFIKVFLSCEENWCILFCCRRKI